MIQVSLFSNNSFISLEAELRSICHLYFPHIPELLIYQIKWSEKKQKRTLASCNIYKKIINVSNCLNYPEYFHLLPPLIYHEICHAVVGVKVGNRGRRIIHGADFKKLERAHPDMHLLEEFIKTGGWAKAVRSHRAKQRWKKIKSTLKILGIR